MLVVWRVGGVACDGDGSAVCDVCGDGSAVCWCVACVVMVGCVEGCGGVTC